MGRLTNTHHVKKNETYTQGDMISITNKRGQTKMNKTKDKREKGT